MVVTRCEGDRGDAEEIGALGRDIIVPLQVSPDPPKAGGPLSDVIGLGVVAAGSYVGEQETEVPVSINEGLLVKIFKNLGFGLDGSSDTLLGVCWRGTRRRSS